MQLASLRTVASGNLTWSFLQKKHYDLFGNLSMSLVQADIKDKGIFYGLQVGPIAFKSAAINLCQKAKARSIGCLIISP